MFSSSVVRGVTKPSLRHVLGLYEGPISALMGVSTPAVKGLKTSSPTGVCRSSSGVFHFQICTGVDISALRVAPSTGLRDVVLWVILPKAVRVVLATVHMDVALGVVPG